VVGLRSLEEWGGLGVGPGGMEWRYKEAREWDRGECG